MTALPPQPPAGMTKAHSAALATLFAGFVSHLLIQYATRNHAAWLDDYTKEAIPDLVTAALAWLAAYLPSNG